MTRIDPNWIKPVFKKILRKEDKDKLRKGNFVLSKNNELRHLHPTSYPGIKWWGNTCVSQDGVHFQCPQCEKEITI